MSKATPRERKVLDKAVSAYKAGRKASNLPRWSSPSEGGYFKGDGDGIDSANEHYANRLKGSGWEGSEAKFLLTVFQDGWSHEASGETIDFSKPLDDQKFDDNAKTYLEELRSH